MAAFPLTQLSEDLDARISKILIDSHVPGASIAVVFEGGAYIKTHGVRRFGASEAVTADTAFDLGSCSKSYIATAVALLVGEGKLSYDGVVRRWLPGIQLDEARITEQLTLRDLLTNCIGLKRQLPVESFADPRISALDLVQRIGKLDRLYPFRRGYVYFNPGFVAARLVVEQASGMYYGDFLEKRLFRPLGMGQSATQWERVNRLSDRASAHVWRHNSSLALRDVYFDSYQGAAGIYSSARDGTRWLKFLLNGRSQSVVASSALAETHRPQTNMPLNGCKLIHGPPEAERIDYCMGWWTSLFCGHRLVQHAGEMIGWRAQTAFLPDRGIGVSVMLSMAVGRHQVIAYTILETLLTGKSRDWCQIADVKVFEQRMATRRLVHEAFAPSGEPSLSVDRYCGVYEHPACGKVDVRQVGDCLELHFRDGPIWDMSLTHLGEHVFESRPKNLEVTDYFPEPLRLRFRVHDGCAVELIDTQASYQRCPC